MPEERLTLSLPEELYEEIRAEAERRGVSIKELVRSLLSASLTVLRLDPSAELVAREQVAQGDGTTAVQETKIVVLW